jgi:hypothetical protein
LHDELGEAVRRHCPAQNDALASIDPMQLDHALCKINSESDDLFHGCFAPRGLRTLRIVARTAAATSGKVLVIRSTMHGRPRLAKLSIHDGLKATIAVMHPDFVASAARCP